MSEAEVDVERAKDLRASFWAGFLLWFAGVVVGALLARREGFYRALLGMSVSVAVVSIVCGGGVTTHYILSHDPQKEAKQVRRARDQVHRVTDVMVREYVEKGSNPRSLSRISNIVSCVDPWENELRLVSKNNRLMIISAGPDGKFDTNDDIRGESVEK